MRDRSREQGDVDGLLLLLMTALTSLALFTLQQELADASSRAYSRLESRSQEMMVSPELWQAWGREWFTLAPRIDYGGYFFQDKDAPAICFYLTFVDGPPLGDAWRCG